MRDAEDVARSITCSRAAFTDATRCAVHRDEDWPCMSGVVLRVADLIRARDAEVAAKAWDEGYAAEGERPKPPSPLVQTPNGSWVPAEPLPWLEEHSRLQRFVYWVRGVGHCGKRGRSEGKYPHLEIEGDWLVEVVNYHTCGAGPGSGVGHEPGCGTIPIGRLATPEHDAVAAAKAWLEGFTRGLDVCEREGGRDA